MKSTLFCSAAIVLVLFNDMIEGADERFVKTNETRIKEYILGNPDYSTTCRPALSDDDTVDVLMSLNIYAMLDLNERDQVLTTASWMKLIWRDHRLQWNSSDYGGVEFVNVYINEIWTPKIFISNALDQDSLSVVSPERGTIIVQSDGVAALGTPLVMETQCQIYVRYFPFDMQACPFFFFTENFIEDRLRLSTTNSSDESEIGSNEWSLVRLTNTRYSLPSGDFGPFIQTSNISLGLFCLFIQRNPSHYIRTLWIPATVLCLMTFVTFLAPPDSGERISLGVSMVLGLTVFQLLIADILPTSGVDPPILSAYLTTNFILACLALPASLMNVNIAFGDSRVFVLRYKLIRKLFLECLPRICGVPSYTQRIADLRNNFEQMVENACHVEEDSMHDKGATKVNGMRADTGSVEEVTSRTEKTKIELRTVALVMDRLAIIVFLVAFLVFLTISVLAFMQNPGVPDDVKELCGENQ